MRSTALALLAACAAFSLSVFAQEPPGRVGRISYLEGPASVYQDPDTGWQEALLNIPVTSENSVWTDRGARAEVQVGGSALRLSSRTQLDISRLDDSGLEATVAEGRVSLRVRYKQSYDHYELSTPSATFEITRDGLYRLEYNADYDESRFSVLAGDARMHSDGGDVAIGPGRMIVVSGGDSPSYDIFAAARPDGFDRWVQTRDARFHPPRNVSAYMTGAQDLEAYGTWSNDPDYGQVWYPTRVSSDWAPYRDGRWSYVEPWGWTWVDDAPWGYAPFHYGRWVNVNNRWGWIPGQHVDRPTWAPALVAFLGLSSASSSPSVGWYPLAPSEQYHPWYRADTRYTERINQVFVHNQPRQNAQARGEQAVQVNRDRGATVVNRTR
jgi:mannose-6-phosphate isomerase-like protein (cupin superfamily)